MVTLQTLANCSTQVIADAFNTAFSDYLIPIALTPEQMQDKITAEDIDLHLSAGAFSNNKLVGFVLHGYRIIDGKKIVYNAGTGVFPNHRGNRLTARLYQYIIPILQLKQIDALQLEVITGNAVALKTYQQVGFSITRSFNCYKGTIAVKTKPAEYTVEEVEKLDEESLKQFCDFQPSWQNTFTTVENLKHHHNVLAAFDSNKIIGYLILNKKTNRIQQVAVHKDYRRKGIASQLFDVMAKRYTNAVSIINIDDSSEATNRFLQSLGLTLFLRQYEMTYLIAI